MSADYRGFALRFCAAFGLEPDEREGRLHLALDGDLAAHFGGEAATWTFTPHDPRGELVAYGSRAFEDMLAYMGGHGRLTALTLPAREVETPAPRGRGDQPEPVEEAPASELFHVFNFQLAFTCDERVERLYAICLDEAGGERPDVQGWLDAAGAVSPPREAANPGEEVLRAAESKAVKAAEAWALPMEREALARLTSVGERLVAYYEAQMREVSPKRRRGQTDEEAIADADDLRWQLRRELERKLRDETARHHMRIQVRRLAHAVVEVPGRRQVYRLAGPRGARELAVSANLYTGAVSYPPCERCGEPGGPYGVCAEGHLACDACLGGCAGCGLTSCHAELAACATCGTPGCASCRVPCASGHEGCAAHLAACPGCGQALCPRCDRPHGCGLEG